MTTLKYLVIDETLGLSQKSVLHKKRIKILQNNFIPIKNLLCFERFMIYFKSNRIFGIDLHFCI